MYLCSPPRPHTNCTSIIIDSVYCLPPPLTPFAGGVPPTATHPPQAVQWAGNWENTTSDYSSCGTGSHGPPYTVHLYHQWHYVIVTHTECTVSNWQLYFFYSGTATFISDSRIVPCSTESQEGPRPPQRMYSHPWEAPPTVHAHWVTVPQVRDWTKVGIYKTSHIVQLWEFPTPSQARRGWHRLSSALWSSSRCVGQVSRAQVLSPLSTTPRGWVSLADTEGAMGVCREWGECWWVHLSHTHCLSIEGGMDLLFPLYHYCTKLALITVPPCYSIRILVTLCSRSCLNRAYKICSQPSIESSYGIAIRLNCNNPSPWV